MDKILLVDDDADIRRALHRNLEWNCQVLGCSSIKEDPTRTACRSPPSGRGLWFVAYDALFTRGEGGGNPVGEFLCIAFPPANDARGNAIQAHTVLFRQVPERRSGLPVFTE